MLIIDIIQKELWDERKNEFVKVPAGTLKLEHSLVSISKWEQKWKKPFLDDRLHKTAEETLDYIKCMTLNKVDDNIYNYLTESDIIKIKDYIDDPATATTINDDTSKGKHSSEIITSELIYFWMTAYNIPVSFQYWHLNRLITLIKVCNIKNEPPKKRSQKELLDRHRAVNDARRAQLAAKRKAGL